MFQKRQQDGWANYAERLETIQDLDILRRCALRNAQLEEEAHKALAAISQDREFWQGKFNTLKWENNKLRKRNWKLEQERQEHCEQPIGELEEEFYLVPQNRE